MGSIPSPVEFSGSKFNTSQYIPIVWTYKLKSFHALNPACFIFRHLDASTVNNFLLLHITMSLRTIYVVNHMLLLAL